MKFSLQQPPTKKSLGMKITGFLFTTPTTIGFFGFIHKITKHNEEPALHGNIVEIEWPINDLRSFSVQYNRARDRTSVISFIRQRVAADLLLDLLIEQRLANCLPLIPMYVHNMLLFSNQGIYYKFVYIWTQLVWWSLSVDLMIFLIIFRRSINAKRRFFYWS